MVILIGGIAAWRNHMYNLKDKQIIKVNTEDIHMYNKVQRTKSQNKHDYLLKEILICISL